MTGRVACPVCGIRRQIKSTLSVCSACRHTTSNQPTEAEALKNGRWVSKAGGIKVWESHELA